MINLSTITKALQSQLNNSKALAGIPVERSEYVNMSSDRAPWIGIYKAGIDYDPNCLGRNDSSWKASVDIEIAAQQTSYGTGEDCEDKLEKLVMDILDAVWSDSTIGGTVDHVIGLSAEYGSLDPQKSETMYFQEAILSIKLEVDTG